MTIPAGFDSFKNFMDAFGEAKGKNLYCSLRYRNLPDGKSYRREDCILLQFTDSKDRLVINYCLLPLWDDNRFRLVELFNDFVVWLSKGWFVTPIDAFLSLPPESIPNLIRVDTRSIFSVNKDGVMELADALKDGLGDMKGNCEYCAKPKTMCSCGKYS